MHASRADSLHGWMLLLFCTKPPRMATTTTARVAMLLAICGVEQHQQGRRQQQGHKGHGESEGEVANDDGVAIKTLQTCQPTTTARVMNHAQPWINTAAEHSPHTGG